MDYNYLTPEQERIIMYKATEVTFTGEYDRFFEEGTFICRKRNAPLFLSIDEVNSGCRWPSFDGSFSKALKWVHDPDRIRTENRICKL